MSTVEGVVQGGTYRAHGKTYPSQYQAEDAVRTLIAYVGQNPESEALRDTPDRVVRMLAELTAGYGQDPKAILGRVFDDSCDELVVVRNVSFVSLCEHHLSVFQGVAHVGYIPSNGKVVGLSKVARLVDCFAKRLQLQERLTRQIATSVQEVLSPVGVGVVLRATHSCLSCRGANKAGAEMVTSVCLGALREDASARAEFLSLCGGNRI